MENKIEYTVFCENVKYLRKTHKLSKKEMAQKLGISVKSLSAIESGILPHRLGSMVLINIHQNFGILPSQMLVPIPKGQEIK